MRGFFEGGVYYLEAPKTTSRIRISSQFKRGEEGTKGRKERKRKKGRREEGEGKKARNAEGGGNEGKYLSLDRLATMTVLAYGAITRTVSAPRDLGLTPVTRTVAPSRSQSQSVKGDKGDGEREVGKLTVLPSNLVLERSSDLFSSSMESKRSHRVSVSEVVCQTR